MPAVLIGCVPYDVNNDVNSDVGYNTTGTPGRR